MISAFWEGEAGRSQVQAQEHSDLARPCLENERNGKGLQVRLSEKARGSIPRATKKKPSMDIQDVFCKPHGKPVVQSDGRFTQRNPEGIGARWYRKPSQSKRTQKARKNGKGSTK